MPDAALAVDRRVVRFAGSRHCDCGEEGVTYAFAVNFTVTPDEDQPQELRRYSELAFWVRCRCGRDLHVRCYAQRRGGGFDA